MIKIEHTDTMNWEAAIRGMRNPMNSWERSDTDFIGGPGIGHNILGDSFPCIYEGHFPGGIALGENDKKLMINLAKVGSVDAKYRRMIIVSMDVTAPLYWWKEFDTYKVGTVANSCSTMHKIHAKEFTLEDFSCEHLLKCDYLSEENADDKCWIYPFTSYADGDGEMEEYPLDILSATIKMLNRARDLFLETKEKRYWWQMIQLLPSSYNQRRTITLNYEVLANIYAARKEHKLDEWREFCDWIRKLPYSEIITLEEKKNMIGFNNIAYDNHICSARVWGDSLDELLIRSQNIINAPNRPQRLDDQ